MQLHVPLLAWWMIVLCQTDCRKTRPSPGGGVEVRSGLGSSGEERRCVCVSLVGSMQGPLFTRLRAFPS
jgi:hypothetical protein